MKVLLRAALAIMVIVALVWGAAEYLLIRQARQAEAQGRITLGHAAMLADPARIGGQFADVVIPQEWERRVTISDLAVWLPPLALNAPHVSLPAQITWGMPDDPRVAEFSGGQALARFSPLHGLALSGAEVATAGARVDDHDVIGDTRITATLTNFGAVIAPGVSAAYRVDIAISNLNLPALAQMLEIGEASGTHPGRAAISGPVVVWLSTLPGLRNPTRPEVMGVIFDGLRITVDGAEMRLWGQLARDEAGQMAGEMALDSTQLRDFVTLLAHAGYMPVGFAPLTASALETVAEATRKKEDAAPVNPSDLSELRRDAGNPHITPRPDGVDRIPLRIEGGLITVGDLPLGALLSRVAPAP